MKKKIKEFLLIILAAVIIIILISMLNPLQFWTEFHLKDIIFKFSNKIGPSSVVNVIEVEEDPIPPVGPNPSMDIIKDEYIDPAGAVLVFNGTEQSLIPSDSGVVNKGSAHYEYKVSYASYDKGEFILLSDWSSTRPKGIDAGKYRIQWKLTTLFGKEKEVMSTINKAPNPIKVEESLNKELEYSETDVTVEYPKVENKIGTVHNEIVSVSKDRVALNNNEITSHFTLTDNGIKVSGKTEIGKYVIRVKWTSDGNNNYEAGSAESLITIEITEKLVTVNPQGVETTYNGSSQSLIKANTGIMSAKLGKFEYRTQYTTSNGKTTSAWSSWSDQKPTGSEAGKYSIQYRSTNSSITNTITSTIKKAANPFWIEPLSEGTVYYGKGGTIAYPNRGGAIGNVYPTINSTTPYISTSYVSITSDGIKVSSSSYAPLGTFIVNVKCRAEGNNNYEESNIYIDVKVTIAGEKLVFTKPTAIENLVYTGSSQTLINYGSVKTESGTYVGSVKYKLNGSTASNLVATNAGTYDISYWVEYDSQFKNAYEAYGNIDEPYETFQVTIKKGTPTINPPTANTYATYATYNVNLVNPGSSKQYNSGSMQYKINDGEWGTTYGIKEPFGEYKVWYYWKGNDNWKDVGSEENPIGYVDVNIGKQKITHSFSYSQYKTDTGIDLSKSTELTIPTKYETDRVEYLYTSIASGAFKNNTYLKKVIIPKEITSFSGSATFQGCSNLQTVVFEEGSTISKIPSNTFSNCPKFTSISIPNSVTNIGYGAFMYDTALNNVQFGAESKLKEIREYAFSDCANLTTLSLPESITTLGERIIDGTRITKIFIPKNLQTMKDCDGRITNSFASAYAEDEKGNRVSYNIQFTIDPENPYFIVENNRIYNPGKTILYAEGTKISNSNIVIDESVEKIASYAFYFRQKTTSDKASLNMPNVEYVYESAFYAAGIGSMSAPNLKYIYSSAFYSSNLTSINLPSIISIYRGAFYAVPLESVTLGPNLSKLEESSLAANQDHPGVVKFITYQNTMENWAKVSKQNYWIGKGDPYAGGTINKIVCTDGTVTP